LTVYASVNFRYIVKYLQNQNKIVFFYSVEDEIRKLKHFQ